MILCSLFQYYCYSFCFRFIKNASTLHNHPDPASKQQNFVMNRGQLQVLPMLAQGIIDMNRNGNFCAGT